MAKKTELMTVEAKDLQIIEYRGQRVVTTEQMAAGYGTDTKNIQDNFQNNRQRFIEGKHYFWLEGEELQAFKRLPDNFGVANKYTSRLILWTERGAANRQTTTFLTFPSVSTTWSTLCRSTFSRLSSIWFSIAAQPRTART